MDGVKLSAKRRFGIPKIVAVSEWDVLKRRLLAQIWRVWRDMDISGRQRLVISIPPLFTPRFSPQVVWATMPVTTSTMRCVISFQQHNPDDINL